MGKRRKNRKNKENKKKFKSKIVHSIFQEEVYLPWINCMIHVKYSDIRDIFVPLPKDHYLCSWMTYIHLCQLCFHYYSK